MSTSSVSPGIPPGGGVAKRGSSLCPQSRCENAPLTSPTHALARILASICRLNGASEVSGVGTERLSIAMSESWNPCRVHRDCAP
eukprot:3590558-Karenia_brevis.AAC.1